MSIKEAVSKSEHPLCQNLNTSRRFAMMPEDVLKSSLPMSAKIVLAAMHMESYGAGEVALSMRCLAETANMSVGSVGGSIKLLEKHGWIEKGGRRQRQVQPYRFLHHLMAEGIKPSKRRGKPVATLVKCKQCNTYQLVDAVNLCGKCRKEHQADVEVRQFLAEKGPAPLEFVYLGLKANGSKSGQKHIHRAYLRATG